MRVENVQITKGKAVDSGFATLCIFSLEVSPELKLYGLQLIEAPDGNLAVRAPLSANGSRSYSMAPRLRSEVCQLAHAAWQQAFFSKVGRIASL